jgi:hypothetical protein
MPINNLDNIIEKLKEMEEKLGIGRDQYVIGYGAALVFWGIKNETNDIDIFVGKDIYDKIPGAESEISGNLVKKYECFDFGIEWPLPPYVSMVDNFLVEKLESIKTHKIRLAREKDLKDILKIDEYLLNLKERPTDDPKIEKVLKTYTDMSKIQPRIIFNDTNSNKKTIFIQDTDKPDPQGFLEAVQHQGDCYINFGFVNGETDLKVVNKLFNLLENEDLSQVTGYFIVSVDKNDKALQLALTGKGFVVARETDDSLKMVKSNQSILSESSIPFINIDVINENYTHFWKSKNDILSNIIEKLQEDNMPLFQELAKELIGEEK